jgi:hypothetical protein
MNFLLAFLVLVSSAIAIAAGPFTIIQLRRDTAANWTSNNPVLHAGEAGFELDNNRLKIGDGTTTWTSLPYVGGGLSALTGDVSASGLGSVAATVNAVGGSTASSVHSTVLAVAGATALDTPSMLVIRDGSGNFAASTVTLTSSAVFDGSSSGSTALQASAIASGTLTLPAATGTLLLQSRQVNTTAPLTGGGALSSDLTLAMPAATSLADGYLASADWVTFNSKQSAITGLGGSVFFSGGGSVVSQDNANFFYDSVNHRLGIGTSVPDYPLTVIGGLRVGNENGKGAINYETNQLDFIPAGASNLLMQIGGIVMGQQGQSFDQYVSLRNEGSGADYNAGSLTLISGRGTGAGTAGNFIFQTADVTTSGSTPQAITTKMTLTANGRLGIGTTAPAESLDIVGGNLQIAASTSTPTGNIYQAGSLLLTTRGGRNIYFGPSSGNLTASAAAQDNTAVGNGTLNLVNTAAKNTAFGSGALAAMVSSNNNTAIGYGALTASTGSNNTAVGFDALKSMVSGGTGTALGNNAGSNATGNDNTFVGNNAGTSVTGGAQNTIIGRGSSTSGIINGTGNTFLGYLAKASGDFNNSTAIGENAIVGQSDAIVLGDSTDASLKVGIMTNTPAATLDVEGYMKLAKYAAGSPPVACSAGQDGTIFLSTTYHMCVCNGGTTTYVLVSDGSTTCL